jgi:hypothetical protein
MSEAVVRVLHCLPWRVHLRAPALVGRRAACERVAERIRGEPGVDEAEVRPSTGSVVLVSRARPLDAGRLAAVVAQAVDAERDEQGRPLRGRHGELHGPTQIAHELAHALAQINAQVRGALDHHADLGTLLPVFFAAGGLAQVIRTRELPAPPWFNLFWWSVRSFMTFNPSALEEEARAAAARAAASRSEAGDHASSDTRGA